MKVRGFGLGLCIAFALILASASSDSANPQVQGGTAAAPAYKFAAATIKPADPNADIVGTAGFVGEDSFAAENRTLRAVIQIAYGISIGEQYLVSGGPSWLDSERYDIAAKIDSTVADSLKRLGPDARQRAKERMLQDLLAERLKLQVHVESKEMQVYFLTVAKNGPKLQKAIPGADYAKKLPYADKFAGIAAAGNLYGVVDGEPGATTETIYGFGVSTFALAPYLTFFSGDHVLDKTGLSGTYDIVLKFSLNATRRPSSDGAADGESAPPPSGPNGAVDIFAAIQQQLGLKLVLGRGPVEMVVIDHVERPSGN